MHDLTRMNGNSFERLIRSLCFGTFGSGGIVYSTGPDGGRDFTFTGKIKTYESLNWDGYLVVQAKYVEKTEIDTLEQIQSLKARIKNEIDTFSDDTSGRRMPRYYIIATNLDLSGADGRSSKPGQLRSGGYTKLSEDLENWKASKAIEDYDIWHLSKIEDLLDGNADVRQSYAAWITPGDVLSAVLSKLSRETADFIPTMISALKNDLKRDRFVKLKDAGDVAETQIRSSQVFIDLPIENKIYNSGRQITNEHRLSTGAAERHMLVSEIVSLSRCKFSTEAAEEAGERSDLTNSGALNNGRVVLLGGPGQGKSTATTFIGQLFRAGIISEIAAHHRDPTITYLLTEILSRAASQGIDLKIPKRFPIVMSLPAFADNISKARKLDLQTPSVLEQIARDLSKSSDRNVEKSVLRSWLTEYPWIVLLDGLDEVPSTGERSSVLEAISTFESEIADSNADVAIIVTTRPQGYNHDFNHDYWKHRRLIELIPEEALSYANGLGAARYPDDKTRREEIESALVQASERGDTARLMISPLQVSIMHLIADTGGSIPSGRWGLFNDYFEVLRKREKAKGKDIQRVLDRNWSLLPPIHQRAGLVLQVDSEVAGSADAKLPYDRFYKLLQDYLAAQGHDESEIASRSAELMDVALNRLVLLSTREEGSVSFDVRSLQEYMAAAALTANDAQIVEARLTHISAISHWRHVFLIAASRCFTDDAFFHLRSAIVAIPRLLDHNEEDYACRNGSILSLEMFIDGIGVDHPNSRRQLALHSLDLLDLDKSVPDARLLKLWEPATQNVILTSLVSRLVGDSPKRAANAWKFLLMSHRSNLGELEDVIIRHLPSDPSSRLAVLLDSEIPLSSDRLVRITSESALSIDARRALPKLAYGLSAQRDLMTELENERNSILFDLDLQGTMDNRSNEDLTSILYKDNFSGLSVRLISIFDESAYTGIQRALSSAPGYWQAVSSVIAFVSDPSKDTLAECLEELSKPNNYEDAKAIASNCYPWLLAKIVKSSTSSHELMEFSRAARAGNFGDADHWKLAENRFKDDIITKADLLHSGHRSGIDENISIIGSPLVERLSVSHGSNVSKFVESVVDVLQHEIPDITRQNLVHAAHFCMIAISSDKKIKSPAIANQLVNALISQCEAGIWADTYDAFDDDLWESTEFVEEIHKLGEHTIAETHHGLSLRLEVIVQAFNSNLRCRGLIPIILYYYLIPRNSSGFSALSKLNNEAFRFKAEDSQAIKFYVACLTVLLKRELPTTLDEFISLFGSEADRIWMNSVIQKVFGSELIEMDRKGPFISAMFKVIRSSGALFDTLCLLHKSCLDGRRSDFATEHVWVDVLKLPQDTYRLLAKTGGDAMRLSV